MVFEKNVWVDAILDIKRCDLPNAYHYFEEVAQGWHKVTIKIIDFGIKIIMSFILIIIDIDTIMSKIPFCECFSRKLKDQFFYLKMMAPSKLSHRPQYMVFDNDF